MSSSSAVQTSTPTATRNHRPDPVHQGDHSGGGTTTRAAQVDRGGEPHAGLDLKMSSRRTDGSHSASHSTHGLKRDGFPFLGTGFGDRFGSSEGCSGSLKERMGKERR